MSDKKPMLLVLAGSNGSGKSTITQYFEKAGTYTNADDVVAAIGMSNEEATKLVDDIRYRSIEAKEDLTFETVLSWKYKLDIREDENRRVLYKVHFCFNSRSSNKRCSCGSKSCGGGHS